MVEIIKEHPIGSIFIIVGLLVVLIWWIQIFRIGGVLSKRAAEDYKDERKRRRLKRDEKKKNERLTEFSIWWTEEKENRFQELLLEESSKEEERKKQLMESLLRSEKTGRSATEQMFDEFHLLKSERDSHLARLKEENK